MTKLTKEQIKEKLQKLCECRDTEKKEEKPDKNTLRAINALEAKYSSELVKVIQEDLEKTI